VEGMTGHERVRRAVHFETPDRLPVAFASLGVTDFKSAVGAIFPSARAETGLGADEWGCVWEKTEAHNMGQVRGHPLADWSALEGYAFPDPDREELYAHMPGRIAEAGGRYVKTGIFALIFERLHMLRGFENVLTDLYLARDRLAALADRIVDVQLRTIRNTASVCGRSIHGLGFTDDWGTQQAAFVSVEMWREFFLPRYKVLFDAIHAAGWDVWMHSCGKVNEIIEPLIEIGVDVLNLQQPRALGIEEIGARYRGRVAFSSLCDIQATLPAGDAGAIHKEAALLLEHWAAPGGGFVLSDYGDGEAIGVPDETKRVMLDAFGELDPWAPGAKAVSPLPAVAARA